MGDGVNDGEGTNAAVQSQPPPNSAGSNVDSSFTGFRPSTQGSRTPAGTLTPKAFFQPLSSQHLQATRGSRPLSWQNESIRDLDDYEERGVTTNRNSTGSALTTKNPPGQIPLETIPPISKGADYSEWAQLAERSAAKSSGTETFEFDTKTTNPKPMAREETSTTWPAESPTKAANGANGTSNGTSNGHAKHSSPVAKASLGKNHQYFTGNTVFCAGGRLQNARDKPIVIITGVLVILPCALFFAFSAPWLWHHVSPAVPIFFAYLFYICISSYLHASLSDPGIFPRNLHSFPPPTNNDPLALAPSTTEWVMVLSPVSQHGAFEVPIKYCKSCNLWRPPRCHHCRVCDNCVETQDHHCMWLNNCVGRRNYRYFFGFVASGTALGIYLFGASIGHVVAWKNQNRSTMSTAIDNNRVPFAMFIYGLICFMYPASLWGYHLFLMARGQTTREFLNSNKFLKKDRHRPFNQKSVWRNWAVVLTRPRPPTYLEFKADYQEGDQRFGVKRDHKFDPFQKANRGVEMQQLGGSFRGPHGRGPIVDRTPREGINVDIGK